MDQDIGLSQQMHQSGAALFSFQVQAGAALAKRNLRQDAGFVPVQRVDPQHIGTGRGEKARCHGTGQHTGEVQHLYARERAFRGPGKAFSV
ncbi:hypothetical protein D3C87_2010090 [compost metagenome]